MRLELRGISKHYPGVVACDDVDLRLQSGEIHAVLGENGAGKSTLMKIIYGAVRADAGTILWNGAAVEIRSPHDARALGISMVFQNFSLFETLTVAENVWLGLESTVSLAAVAERISAVGGQYGLEIDPDRPVHTLAVGQRQRVEIVRALLTDPSLLILDEPTSVLTPQAVDRLFDTLRKLAATGCSILYISHKLDEIRRLCHNCTILRAGRVTGEVDPALETNASLSRLMIGADPPRLRHEAVTPGAVVIEVRALSLPQQDRFGTALRDIDLQVRSGEIVGIAGVSGNGQRELLAALSGEDLHAEDSAIRLFGNPIGRLGPRRRRRLGLHFVPEERLGRGAVPGMSLAQNVLLTRLHDRGRRRALIKRGWIGLGAVAELARSLIGRFAVKADGSQSAAMSLSGGNLQKFIVGREIDAEPRALIVSQPTWGVDVGAAAQIRAELLALRGNGCAVLVVSEELDELFEISDRLVVIAGGRLSPSIPIAEANVETIGQWMSGLWPGAATGGETHAA